MNILITGAGGQVGLETAHRASPGRWDTVRLDRAALDITDKTMVAEVVDRMAPDAVINLAAYTAVDRAESEPERAFAVNAAGPETLAAECAARRISLLHVSTDYVFDGAKRDPYDEGDPVAPIGVYGASKEAGEAAIRRILDRHLIVRTAWVYGRYGGNFVKTMLRLGAERDSVRVVADQIGSPTWAADIAATLVRLAIATHERNEGWGTYHYAGAGETSWAGFADTIFELAAAKLGRRPDVIPIATVDYPTPAQRPANSRLVCGKIERQFGIVARPWQDGLENVLSQLLASGTGGGS